MHAASTDRIRQIYDLYSPFTQFAPLKKKKQQKRQHHSRNRCGMKRNSENGFSLLIFPNKKKRTFQFLIKKLNGKEMQPADRRTKHNKLLKSKSETYISTCRHNN